MKSPLALVILGLFVCEILFPSSTFTQCTDADEDGYYSEEGCGSAKDCNDASARMHPGTEEMCNSHDDDCDGLQDEGCDTTCDSPYTSGSDVRIMWDPAYSEFPSTVWTGSEYGLSWMDRRDGNDEIYFARIRCNQTPSANVGENSTSECASPQGTAVALDAAASIDADSSPGTNNDIVTFEWFEHYGASDQILLGTGEILDVMLPLGRHLITLKFADSAGQTDTDEVVKTVVDTLPPNISVSAKPDTLWPPDQRMREIKAEVIATDIRSGRIIDICSFF